ncbi:hypothetical protein [Streptomyces pseudovenezuelae]|uniref:hypothetical protein n=1 Tax=Streptomyces pseudovenezuelae TaxID=67350 RepID=UPI002E821C78|nr:hypothetical protein [Streptomyces pseudovenezuelae]WUA94412.1 hypothetical protein OHO81_45045 [Streptomyces pseudovenezuelae]
MARTIRDRLTVAARELREAGKAESADAVEAVLTPGGWTLLREQEGTYTTNIPLTIRQSLRNALEAAAQERVRTLSAVVAQGHQEVVAGTWKPPRPAGRALMAPGDSRVVLNVTVDDRLRKELRARLAPLSAELGYKVTESGIAIGYLREKLGVTDEVLGSYVKRLAP